MSGDWIKMQSNLDTNPKVVMMAAELGITEIHVVGALWKIWAWADQHSVDGNAISVTETFIDRITGVTGLSESLRNVGWLTGENGCLTFPNFEEHNGTTAKSRALSNKRVKRHRNGEGVTKALPEKRREENKKSKPKKVEKPLPPDWQPSETLAAWFKNQDFSFTLDDMAEEFRNGCKAKGYTYVDFDAAFRTWCKKRQERQPAQPRDRYRPA